MRMMSLRFWIPVISWLILRPPLKVVQLQGRAPQVLTAAQTQGTKLRRGAAPLLFGGSFLIHLQQCVTWNMQNPGYFILRRTATRECSCVGEALVRTIRSFKIVLDRPAHGAGFVLRLLMRVEFEKCGVFAFPFACQF